MSTPSIVGRSALAANPGVRQAKVLLPPVLCGWIDRLGGRLSQVCGYQLGMYDLAGRPTGQIDGKLLRPAFALLCSAATGGQPADVVPAGAAIELLHNASLIHDDIMDGDRERRHRPTVWTRFGVPMAIVAGDALIALAFEVLASHRHPVTTRSTAVLAPTLRLLACGQDSDLRFESESTVDVDKYLAMIARKTGVLLGCACRLGAAYSLQGPPDQASRFGRFGVHLGVAFQLVDDVLGIWGDPAVTGKPVGADLRARKKSAPVVATLAAGTPDSAHFAALYAGSGEFTDDDVVLLAGLLEASGGRAWAMAEADRQVSAAWDFLDGLGLDLAARTSLETLTNVLMSREY